VPDTEIGGVRKSKGGTGDASRIGEEFRGRCRPLDMCRSAYFMSCSLSPRIVDMWYDENASSPGILMGFRRQQW